MGEVIYVSADLHRGPPRRLDLLRRPRRPRPRRGRPLAAGISLTAGMPVEVAIQTGARRAGDYFLEPILRRFRRALREE